MLQNFQSQYSSKLPMFFKDTVSKVLLFGEYSILYKSQALTIPFSKYHGQLKYNSSLNEESNSLYKLLDYLETVDTSMDLDKFKLDLDLGLFFDSSIPLGQGLGSSAALSASLFKSYCENSNLMTLEELMKELGLIESFFHGKSSGLDPLVCFVGEPILLNSFGELEVVKRDLKRNSFRVFLVPTFERRNGKEVIEKILSKLNDKSFEESFIKEYVFENDECVSAFLEDRSTLKENIKKLSKLQVKYFGNIISDEILPLWKTGLETDEYIMKLCGAGGGGYYLAFSYKDDFIAPLDWHHLEIQ